MTPIRSQHVPRRISPDLHRGERTGIHVADLQVRQLFRPMVIAVQLIDESRDLTGHAARPRGPAEPDSCLLERQEHLAVDKQAHRAGRRCQGGPSARIG